MQCDLCAKNATAIAQIEGARLTVCAACAKHGTLIRELPPAKQEKKTSSALDAKASAKTLARNQKVQQVVEEVRKDLSSVLRKEREQRSLTQEQFAKLLQVKLSTYHHFEGGVMLPDIELARKIEHIIKIPLIRTQQQESWERKDSSKEEPRSMMLSDFIKKKK